MAFSYFYYGLFRFIYIYIFKLARGLGFYINSSRYNNNIKAEADRVNNIRNRRSK